MKVVVAGSHGVIGTHLVHMLQANDHEVYRLIRAPGTEAGIGWDPVAGTIQAERLNAMDWVINLAGPRLGPASRTVEGRADMLTSRVNSAGLLARTLATLDKPPSVFASASALAYYGDAGDQELTEASPPGPGYLAEITRAWEQAAAQAETQRTRVALLRFGRVLSTGGGSLAALLPQVRQGQAGAVGTGRQWVSWISLADAVGAICHILADPSLGGPINVTAPHPVRNATFMETLADLIQPPARRPMPAHVVEALLGEETARQTQLASQRALPVALLRSGYVFQHLTLGQALESMLGR